jgi:uncharacterized membrane protein
MENLIDIGLTILQALILAVAPILAGYIIQFVKAKAANLKQSTDNSFIWNIINLIEGIVANVVAYVQQTYVDNLKKDGKFNAEEQKIAFEKAYNGALELISEEQKALIESLFGNFGDWLSILIEAAVRNQK